MARWIGWIRRGRWWDVLVLSKDEWACWQHLNCQPDKDDEGRPFSKVVLPDGVNPVGKEEVKK